MPRMGRPTTRPVRPGGKKPAEKMPSRAPGRGIAKAPSRLPGRGIAKAPSRAPGRGRKRAR